MRHPPLILASASPRRRALLALLGLPFNATSADLQEQRLERESPREMVMRLSRAKADTVGAASPEGIIIACDTIVVLGGDVLGKPADPVEATGMLRRLKGREHNVLSGLAVVDVESGESRTACDETAVLMRAYGDDEIAAYVASGEPLDKAGAYAIQSVSFHPVTSITGCYASVMGLPLQLAADLLRSFDLRVTSEADVAAACSAFTGHPCCRCGGW